MNFTGILTVAGVALTAIAGFIDSQKQKVLIDEAVEKHFKELEEKDNKEDEP